MLTEGAPRFQAAAAERVVSAESESVDQSMTAPALSDLHSMPCAPSPSMGYTTSYVEPAGCAAPKAAAVAAMRVPSG